MLINLLKGFVYTDYSRITYKINTESNPTLSVYLVLVIFFIILFKIFLKRKKIIYPLDFFDFLFIVLIFLSGIYIILSKDLMVSLDYIGRLYFLGVPYFFISKLYFSNCKEIDKSVKQFLVFFVILAILISLIAIYLHQIAPYPFVRLSIPTVGPIPFANFIGLACLILIAFLFLYKVRVNKFFFNYIALGLLLFTLLWSNTRGALVALVGSLIFYFVLLSKVKISPKKFMIVLGVFFLFIIGLVAFVDIDSLFKRFVDYEADSFDSFSPRIAAYIESLEVFLLHPLGIGCGMFKYYSTTESYPHNIFLEILVSFGIVGFLFNLLLISTIIIHIKQLSENFKSLIAKNNYLILLALIVAYFFIEKQFSYTLWMHKYLYFFIGVFSAYKIRSLNTYVKKDKVNL